MLRGLAVTLLIPALCGCGALDPRPEPLAQNCGGWLRLDQAQQIQTAEALIPPQAMEAVRERQQLSADTIDADVYVAVTSSVTKVCELESRPGLPLSDVVTGLYR
jgi:hypothetical protein